MLTGVVLIDQSKAFDIIAKLYANGLSFDTVTFLNGCSRGKRNVKKSYAGRLFFGLLSVAVQDF